MLEAQELSSQRAVIPGKAAEPSHGVLPGAEGTWLEEPAPVPAQYGRHQGQVSAGVVNHVGFQIVDKRFRVGAGKFGQVA